MRAVYSLGEPGSANGSGNDSDDDNDTDDDRNPCFTDDADNNIDCFNDGSEDLTLMTTTVMTVTPCLWCTEVLLLPAESDVFF